MELSERDIQDLRQARELVMGVASRVDCGYCRSHLEVTADMISDAIDITKFNLLYADDEKALQKMRQMLQDEATLRLLALASRVVGMFRRVTHGRAT